MAERQLAGGITNEGRVVPDGPHVLRPAGPHTGSIHTFLRALRRTGFDGAPEPIGVDPDGRERLVFVEGDVPLVRYPEWCTSDDALASVAALLRRFHDAAREFDPSGHTWSGDLADPSGGVTMCHNDAEPSNVVFRGGVAVALLDFEFAAPGRPVHDLAHLARVWTPIDGPVDRERVGWPDADRPARLRIVADAYGLDRRGRTEVIGALDDAIEQVEVAVRRSVEEGVPGAVALWNRSGGSRRFDRRRRWWSDHREQFAAALR